MTKQDLYDNNKITKEKVYLVEVMFCPPTGFVSQMPEMKRGENIYVRKKGPVKKLHLQYFLATIIIIFFQRTTTILING